MNKSILLVGVPPEAQIAERLYRLLQPVGRVTLAQGNEYDDQEYAMVIFNAATIKNINNEVDKVMLEQPKASVFILTASPTFQRARSAVRKGVQYIDKSLTDEEINKVFRNAMRTT